MSDMWNDFTGPMPEGYNPPQGRVNALNTPQDRDCMGEDGEEELEAVDS